MKRLLVYAVPKESYAHLTLLDVWRSQKAYENSLNNKLGVDFLTETFDDIFVLHQAKPFHPQRKVDGGYPVEVISYVDLKLSHIGHVEEDFRISRHKFTPFDGFIPLLPDLEVFELAHESSITLVTRAAFEMQQFFNSQNYYSNISKIAPQTRTRPTIPGTTTKSIAMPAHLEHLAHSNVNYPSHLYI